MADIAGLKKDGIYHKLFNPITDLPVGDNVPEEVNMLVEIPKGGMNKYEFNTKTGILKLDRVMFAYFPYPIEYGAIPQTWDEDNDPLDVMSLITYPTFPGCLISVRPVGVMKMNDSGEIDDKILAVPTDDIRFKHIKDLSDVPAHTIDEIKFYWENYKTLQFKYKNQTDKSVKVEGFFDKKAAFEIIESSQKRFIEKFGKQEKNCKCGCDDCC